MVFLYHRLLRPSILDPEFVPRFIREIYYKIRRRLLPKVNFKTEAQAPVMMTEFPGPQMKALLNDVETVSQDNMNHYIFFTYPNNFSIFFRIEIKLQNRK